MCIQWRRCLQRALQCSKFAQSESQSTHLSSSFTMSELSLLESCSSSHILPYLSLNFQARQMSTTTTTTTQSSLSSIQTEAVPTSSANASVSHSPRNNLPKRFVRRWYLPGMEEDEVPENKELTEVKQFEEEKSTASTHKTNEEKHQPEEQLNKQKTTQTTVLANNETNKNEVDSKLNVHKTKELESATPVVVDADKCVNDVSALPSSASHAESNTALSSPLQSSVNVQHDNENDNDENMKSVHNKVTKPLSVPKVEATREEHAPFVTDTDGSPLPLVLTHDLEEDNKKMKKLLMMALGKEFARAGLYTDGLQTSYSVVNYHELKERTGLTRIPAKLLLSCFTVRGHDKDWIDISAHPTSTVAEYREALHKILINLGVKRDLVEDSTAELQLPHALIMTSCNVLVLRYAIDVPEQRNSLSLGGSANSFQDLTNRFTLYMMPTRCITVHRTHCTFVEELKLHWNEMCANEDVQDERFFVHYFVKTIIHTFNKALASCISEFDLYEANLFASSLRRSSLAREIYHIKRRASVYGRALTLTQDAFTHAANALQLQPYHVRYQEIQHDLAHIHALADNLNSNADSVLQILFQLSSYQVNELMRVLTLFSAFFIPLSFIAAVYGMNFDSLPLLHTSHGEMYCGALMGIVACTIYVWFKINRFIEAIKL